MKFPEINNQVLKWKVEITRWLGVRTWAVGREEEEEETGDTANC